MKIKIKKIEKQEDKFEDEDMHSSTFSTIMNTRTNNGIDINKSNSNIRQNIKKIDNTNINKSRINTNSGIDKNIDKSNSNTISQNITNIPDINQINSIGTGIGLGKQNRVNIMQDLQFKKVKGRREFMDSIKSHIQEKGRIEYSKLDAYFQYTTGASTTLIQQCLAVMENLGLIACEEVHIDSSRYVDVYFIPEDVQ